MASIMPQKRTSAEELASTPPKKQKAVDALEEKRKKLEDAKARAAAVAASLGRSDGMVAPVSAGLALRNRDSTTQKGGPVSIMDDKARADIRARIAALKQKSSGTPNVPTTTNTRFTELAEQQRQREDIGRSRGGLEVGLHPALLSDAAEGGSFGRKQAIQPKFATTMANKNEVHDQQGKAKSKKLVEAQRPTAEENAKNPYFDPKLEGGAATRQKARAPKALIFNQKGKYIEQANALRRQAHLEKIKKRIADAARRAGIEEEMDTDKAFLKEAPPDVEWWDQGICSNQTYDDVGTLHAKIDTEDSIITIYIQHPILIEPPMEKLIPEARPLPLTKKEQKKVRRQKRMESLKDKQAKIRLGLEPAPPPKIKKSNMMRVLGDEAVKDPTAVEARVNKEIAARHDAHLQENEERKLTKEQRHDKIIANQEKDLSKGIHCLVFRIENLSNKAHRYKVNINIEQLGLTGICILNPKMNLLIVEGGAWGINKYKKLMINRIAWSDTTESNLSMHTQDNDEGQAKKVEDTGETQVNTCTLVWEGELKVKAFKRYSTSKCASEGEVRKVLERSKMENYWTLAKSKVPEQSQ